MQQLTTILACVILLNFRTNVGTFDPIDIEGDDYIDVIDYFKAYGRNRVWNRISHSQV